MAERKNFDSEFCGSLPLHHINSIQDYGYLLIVDIKGLSVIQASENTPELFGKDIKVITTSLLSDFIEQAAIVQIKLLLERGIAGKFPLAIKFVASIATKEYHAFVHIKDDYIIIEIEKDFKTATRDFVAVFQDIKYFSVAIDHANSVQEVCEVAIHELKKLSGFDGILMYRFDANWNGEVIAEEKKEGMEKYIGQIFPASDVPKQARHLYLKNPYRLIPNRNYKPVRLYPVINPVTHAFVDLSDCNLRGVAAVHLEYMKNMNVTASMSIRVIYNEALWGLISCHHINDKYLNNELCALFEWLSEVISNRITLILNKEEYKLTQDLQQKRIALTDRVYAEDNMVTGLLPDDLPGIMELFNASGVLVSLNRRIETRGFLPGKDEIDNLMLWLEGKNLDQVFSTDYLSGVYQDSLSYSKEGSGLLVIPIDSERGDFVVCFRPEVVEDINWGGDPNNAVNFDKDGKSYHPRNSFKMWKQTVHNHSFPWKKQELEVAASLRNFLFEFRTKQLQN